MNFDYLPFKRIISGFYLKLSYEESTNKILKEFEQNLCENNFCLLELLYLDYTCVCEAVNFADSELYNIYAKDYAKRYNETLRVVDNLQSSLKGKKDYYYPEFLFNGTFKTYDFDDCGLLLDPAREFIAERLDIYNQNRESDFIYTSPVQADALDNFNLIKKSIITKAEDLYLGKQFDYMEKCLQNRELRQVEPFINYEKVKTENLANAMEILAQANAKDLFLRDKNEPLPKLMPITQDSVLKSNGNSYIFDLDNFEWTNKQGKEVDPKDVLTLKKILQHLRKELIKLINSKSFKQGM